MRERYLCPIHACPWYYDQASPVWDPGHETAVRAADDAISVHLDSHTKLDWFREVRRQSDRANTAEAKIIQVRAALDQALAELSRWVGTG